MAVFSTNKISRIGFILMSALWLGACGGETGSGTGTLSLSITDAPVDGAERVEVEFTGVTIQGDSGRIDIDYAAPKTINLLALQGGLRVSLLERLELDAGHYSWIRLKVNASADGVMDSYIRINGADYELNIPSGSQTGLKLINSFNVVANEVLDLTIDFDLRKSVHQPPGQINPDEVPVYFLRPTLRLIETKVSGTISGQVDPIIFSINEQNCSDPEIGYVVYLYGGDVAPDDMDGMQPDPVTTAAVNQVIDPLAPNVGGYVYTLAFVEPGDYTIALTCNGDLDEPYVDNSTGTGNPVVTFVGTAAVSVTVGANTNHDF